jgi:hypothetical protein
VRVQFVAQLKLILKYNLHKNAGEVKMNMLVQLMVEKMKIGIGCFYKIINL